MKRTLAFILALVVALGMSTVAFADEGDLVYKKNPSMKIDTDGEAFAEDSAEASFTVTVQTALGEAYIEDAEEGHQDEEIIKVSLDDVELDAIDNVGTAYTVERIGTSNSFTVTGANGKADEIWLRATGVDSEGKEWFENKQLVRPEKPVHQEPDPAIVTAIRAAIEAKATTAYVNLDELADKGVVYPVDWKYITNTYFEGDWYPNYEFLNLSLQFYWPGSGTTFFIDADDLDYTWAKLVDFNETTGLSNYEGKTEGEMLNTIRALTGATKNPYTFGFSMADSHEKRGTDVPKMTVSKVVPQQWLNVYGQKNLELFVFSDTEKCEVCGEEHKKGHVVESTTLDAVAQTQRVSYKTADLYKTMVLSKTISGTTAVQKPTTDNNPSTGTANPSTGANDIVSVAVVFAVISLASAGAFLTLRAKSHK